MKPTQACLVASFFASTAALARPCFLLEEEGGKELIRQGGKTCARRFSPASTFKIPHALIALEAGAVADEHQTFHPPPGKKSLREWERDHDLASAMHFSVVWYFQELAGRLGSRTEAEWLQKLDYGNRDASGDVRQFWLNDTLQISPDEQLKFLERFFAGRLPASAKSQATVKRILEQEPGKPWAAGRTFAIEPWPAGAVLRAKSGTSVAGRGVSWYVGELERDGKKYVFVSCVPGKAKSSAAAAKLAFKQLRKAKLLP